MKEMLQNRLTDDQVHTIYDSLSDIDKKSTDDLNAAEKETDEANYTSDDNAKIDDSNIIPGIKDVDLSITDSIEESQENIKDALNPYTLDEKATVQMLNLIEEYKKGNKNNLYSKLPSTFKKTVDMLAEQELKNFTGNPLQIKNAVAALIIESFINDAKMSASVEEFSSEMNKTVAEMHTEYDIMINKAIDDTFSKIDEIRTTNPEQAERLESIKNAFDNALTFEEQLNYVKNTPSFVLRKDLNDYIGILTRFNTKVNNNTFGVKVPKIEEIVPIINNALPKYKMNDIKKFMIAICKTSKDPKDLAGTAYNYRLISSIYRYKFTAIDEKGKAIFENISKVIDEIIS
jgi:hypothetical protein